MSDEVRATLERALEEALRQAMRDQPDPVAYLDGIRDDVLPALLLGQRADGTMLADPSQAAVVASIFDDVVRRLRREWRG